MKKITTESGAIYHYDEENSRVMREGPNSPGIDYSKVPDGGWDHVEGTSILEVGRVAGFLLGFNNYRITTPVVTIEEVES